jgi:hypothetical protein
VKEGEERLTLNFERLIKARGSAKERSMTISVVRAIGRFWEARKQNSHGGAETRRRQKNCGYRSAEWGFASATHFSENYESN